MLYKLKKPHIFSYHEDELNVGSLLVFKPTKMALHGLGASSASIGVHPAMLMRALLKFQNLLRLHTSSSPCRPLNHSTSSQDYILWLTDKTESQVLNPCITVYFPQFFLHGLHHITKRSWAFLQT